MHEIKPIIDPLPREELLRELTPDRKVRDTKRAGNEIYIFTAAECPALMREVGRLREIAFRAAGGGTGEEADIDGEDRAEGGYHQLIVWDPAAQEIVGGYRFIVCTSSRQPHLSTEHYFHFSDLFRRRYLPHTIELGRSFIQPAYQARSNTKSIYALDNLWDGLGALIVLNPKAKYLFGKVTMYSSYQTVARNTLIYFLHKYFPDRDRLVTGRHPIDLGLDDPYYERIFTGENYVENYHILIQRIREFNENIPPLINSYMNLSPTMRVFDTVENPDFGGVEETGILLAIKDIYLEKRERYTRWDGWRANLRAADTEPPRSSQVEATAPQNPPARSLPETELFETESPALSPQASPAYACDMKLRHEEFGSNVFLSNFTSYCGNMPLHTSGIFC